MGTFSKACDTGDVRTAHEEFQKYVASGDYIPKVKVFAAVDFFEKQGAWEEAGQTVLSLVKRGIEAQLIGRLKCVSNILENSRPELVKEVGDALKLETKKKFKVFKKPTASE